MLAEATAMATAAGTTIETVIAEEEAPEALAEVGRLRDARAIVVGSHGESPLRGALLGSTPHKLLHLADRPVLVVPA